MRHILPTIFVTCLTISFSGIQAKADVFQCLSKFKASSRISGESPGMLSTRKDTPCRLARRMKKGTADGIKIIEQPKNGKLTMENRSTVIFTPKTGFVGTDVAVVKMLYGKGDSEGGLVRFSISVQ